MNISGINSAQHVVKTAAADGAAQKTLNACREVEGVFVGLLLKEGLKPMLENSEENSSNSGQLMEYAVEEAAREISGQGGLGMADSLYDQLTLGR